MPVDTNDADDNATKLDSQEQAQSEPAQERQHTRLQNNIWQPKQRTDGTIPFPTNCRTFAAAVSSEVVESSSLSEALSCQNWKQAMQEECDALLRNKTWKLIPQNSAQNLIDSKWVYKLKYKADGTLERYKARLVAKGLNRGMELIMIILLVLL